MKRACIVGAGLMGSSLSRCLVSRGYELLVYNRSTGRAESLCARLGCYAARSLDEVRSACSSVLLLVSDDEAVYDLVGSLAGRPTIINMSTVTPQASLRLYRRLGSSYLEAPVYGSVDAAGSCSLLTMAAGEEGTFEKARGLLEDFSREVLYLGPVPRASALKLALNNLGIAFPALLAESLALLEAWGVEAERLREAAAKLWFGPLVERYWDRAIGRSGGVRFRLALAAKDMHYVSRALREKGLPAPVSSGVAELYSCAAASGMGGEDYPRVAGFLLRLAEKNR